jgi:hypothetical protein
LDQDCYLDEVERSLVAQQGCLVLLDLARRVSLGDHQGARERIRFLEPPRQRLLTRSLRQAGGILERTGALLDAIRGRPDALDREEVISSRRPRARRLPLAGTPPQGRIAGTASPAFRIGALIPGSIRRPLRQLLDGW